MRLPTISFVLFLTGCAASVDQACVEDPTPIELDHFTVLGFSPASILEISGGRHEASLASQDADPTELTIQVSATGAAASWVQRQPGMNSDLYAERPSSVRVCPDAIRLPVQLQFQSSDARFDEVWLVELESVDGELATFHHRVLLQDMNGTWSSPHFDGYQSVTVEVQGQFDAAGSYGTVNMIGQTAGAADETWHIAVWPGE
jgi:hypothetical protein